MKKCSGCEQILSPSKFYKDASHRDGLTSKCMACVKARVLKGRNVSGLHVHYNLQVLKASENISKGNRW